MTHPKRGDMREIKFRAFHKEEKKMCEVATINFSDGFAYLLGVKPGEDQFIGDREVVVAPKDGRACSFAEIELMQFSGKKDKFGKEIWEDDIVKNMNPGHVDEGYKDTIARVCFLNGSFIENYWNMPLHDYQNLEIIGNIYESPDLLK